MIDLFYMVIMFISWVGIMFSVYLLRCLHRADKLRKPQTCSKDCPYEVYSEVRREWGEYWRYVLTGNKQY